jgi:hypothetical protein
MLRHEFKQIVKKIHLSKSYGIKMPVKDNFFDEKQQTINGV